MRVYRWLLRALPRTFRERFGDDMTDVFGDRLRLARRQGPRAVAALWVRTIADILSAAAGERRGDRSTRHERRSPPMIVPDIRQAWRSFHRHPGHSAAVLVTLGLGIGAATAVFAVANALIFRSLPFAHPDRLMRLYEVQDQEGFAGSVSPGNLDDWCRIAAFERCGAYVMSDVNLAAGTGDTQAGPERVRAALATAGLFDVIGVSPTAGRLFTARDADAREPVVVVSETARRRMFAGGEALNRSLRIDGAIVDVIGVVPAIPGFEDVAVWRPAATSGQPRNNHSYRAIARLREGAAPEAAQAQLAAVAKALEGRFPDTNAHWSARVEPLQAFLTRNVTGAVGALGTLVGVLVALCAASVASLATGRALARRRELAIRLALGASRGRLIGQLLAESVFLSLAGAAAGWTLARWAVSAVVAVLPPRLSLWRAPDVDLQTLLFAAAVACGTALLFGLLPALSVVRAVGPASGLRDRFGRASGRRTRTALVTIQTALATLLLVAATLLGAVLTRVLTRGPGFETENVLAFTVTPPRATYSDQRAVSGFFDALTERLRRLPQVEAAGSVMNLPLAGGSVQRGVIRFGDPIPRPGSFFNHLALFQVSTPGYLPALRIPLIDGRDFSAEDTAASPPVAIINQRLASTLWPGGRAVGEQLHVYTDEKTPRLVVGVIADIPQTRLENAVIPEYYAPLAQAPRRSLTFVLRARGPLSRADIQAEISAIDPALPLYDLMPMDAVVAQSTSARRALTRLAVFFAGVALLLSAVALYGLVSAGVTERTREIGVRLALGAPATRIMRSILARGLLTATVGAIAGIAAAIPGIGVVSAMLTATPPSAAGAIAVVTVLLMTVSLAACWIPARRALSVDPVASLRSE